jgi:hypothetical protein
MSEEMAARPVNSEGFAKMLEELRAILRSELSKQRNVYDLYRNENNQQSMPKPEIQQMQPNQMEQPQQQQPTQFMPTGKFFFCRKYLN